MSLALLEIRRRKLQFALVTGVVALIAYLVLMVTGLGLGLQARAGTALLALDGEYLAYAERADLSVIRSRLTSDQVDEIAGGEGVEDAAPIGYVAAVVEYGDGEHDTLAVVGVEPDSLAAPQVVEGEALTDGGGEVLIDRGWANRTGVGIGDEIALPSGFETVPFTVSGFVDEGYFFFQSATYISLEDWRGIAYQGDREQAPAASIVLVQGQALEGTTGDGWEIVTKQQGFDNIEGVAEQQSTVNALRYMGLLIGAMVVGVFFYVITIQKIALLGILKAIGASGWYLARQSVLQVLLISIAGTAIAAAGALATRATVLASADVPIEFTTGAIVTTSIFMIVAGLLGAALSARQSGSVDPIVAMQQQ